MLPFISSADIWKKHLNSNRCDKVLGNGNDIWVLSDRGGLTQWNLDTGEYKRYYENFNLYTNSIIDFVYDDDNRLLIVDNLGNINRFEEGEFKKITKISFSFQSFIFTNGYIHVVDSGEDKVLKYDGDEWETYKALDQYEIVNIFPDPRGGFWAKTFGSETGEFIYYNNGVKQKFENRKISNESLTEFYVDQYGIVWALLKNRGIAWYDGESWTPFYWEGETRHFINNMVRDKNGIIWLAANDEGLFTFDGEKLMQDLHFSGENILWVENAPNENILIGTDLSFEIYNGEIRTSYKIEGLLPLSNHLKVISLDYNENIWCGDINGDIAYLDHNNWKRFLGRNITGAKFDNPGDLNCICPSRNSGVWAGFNNDLIRFIEELWVSYYEILYDEIGCNIVDIEESQDGDIWVATNKGLGHWKDESWDFQTINVNDMDFDNEGNLWVLGEDILKWDGNRWIEVLYREDFPGLSEGSNALTAMKDGTIWICGGSCILILYDDKPIKYFDSEDGIPSINSIVEAPDGTIWMFSEGNLIHYDWVNFQTYTSTDAGFSISGNDLAVDKTGRIYIVGNYYYSPGLIEFTPSSVTLKMNLFAPGLVYHPGDELSLSLMINNYGPEEIGDLYFVMIAPDGLFYSFPEWNEGTVPVAKNLIISEGFSMPMIEAINVNLPSYSPPINQPGEYVFALALTAQGSTFIRSKGITIIKIIE